MILEVRGSAGLARKTIRLSEPFTAKNTIKLRYVHLPPLPLTPRFVGAVNVQEGQLSDIYDIEPQPSLAALADALDKLYFDEEERLMHAYYDGGAFEINNLAQTLNFGETFATFLKFPGTMIPDAARDSNLDASHIHHFSHYEVVVKQTKGTYTGTGFDECVGRIRRDGKIIAGEHHFTGPVINLEVEVYLVDIGGGGKLIAPDVDWAVGFDLK